MSNKMTPEMRFKGFTQDWEQRKLGEIATFSKGSGYTKGDLVKKGTPIILYGRLYTKYQTVITQVDTFADMKEKSVMSEGDEVIVPSSGESSDDISRASVVGNSGILLGGDLNIIRTNSDINSIFLALAISNGKQQKELSKRAQGKSIVHLHNSDLKKVKLIYPTVEEQIKIGIFFKKLDDTIALHQDKLEKLNQLRNGYLQIIFPQRDEKTPHLRFANFSSDWEKRKLEDLATFSKGSGYTKSDLVEEGTPIILYGRLYTKYQTIIEHVDTFVKMKEKSVLSEGDEVIVPSSGESSEDIARASVVATADILLGGDLNIIKTISDINSTFLALNISNGKQQKELSKKAQGKSVVHLRNSDLKKIDLTYPVVEVQIQIGNFFKQLDHTITLQHNKTEKLKQLKKVYLQKLFV